MDKNVVAKVIYLNQTNFRDIDTRRQYKHSRRHYPRNPADNDVTKSSRDYPARESSDYDATKSKRNYPAQESADYDVTKTAADPNAPTNDYRNWFDKDEDRQTENQENLQQRIEPSNINQIGNPISQFDQQKQIEPSCSQQNDQLNRPMRYDQEGQSYDTPQDYQLPPHHSQMLQYPPLQEEKLRPVQRYDAQTPYDPLDSLNPDPYGNDGRENRPQAPPAPSISFLPPPILPTPSSYPPAPVPPPYPPQWSNPSVGVSQFSG